MYMDERNCRDGHETKESSWTDGVPEGPAAVETAVMEYGMQQMAKSQGAGTDGLLGRTDMEWILGWRNDSLSDSRWRRVSSVRWP